MLRKLMDQKQRDINGNNKSPMQNSGYVWCEEKNIIGNKNTRDSATFIMFHAFS